MTEAVTKVIRYLFEDEFLDAITCCYYVQNDRSARVQEKCGFEFVRASVHETTFGEKRDVRYMSGLMRLGTSRIIYLILNIHALRDNIILTLGVKGAKI